MVDSAKRSEVLDETLSQLGSIRYELGDLNCEKVKLEAFRGENKENGFSEWRKKIDKRESGYELEHYETAQLRLQKNNMWEAEDKLSGLKKNPPKKKKHKNIIFDLVALAFFVALFYCAYTYMYDALMALKGADLGNSEEAIEVIVHIAIILAPALMAVIFFFKFCVDFIINISYFLFNSREFRIILKAYKEDVDTYNQKVNLLSNQIGGYANNGGLIEESYNNLINQIELNIEGKLNAIEYEIGSFRSMIAKDKFDFITAGKFDNKQLDEMSEYIATGKAKNYNEAMVIMHNEHTIALRKEQLYELEYERQEKEKIAQLHRQNHEDMIVNQQNDIDRYKELLDSIIKERSELQSIQSQRIEKKDSTDNKKGKK